MIISSLSRPLLQLDDVLRLDRRDTGHEAVGVAGSGDRHAGQGRGHGGT